MGLEFRWFTHEDETALVRLWCDHGGWDKVDVPTWRKRVLEAPAGEARIVVATDTQQAGKIVGQFVFIPFRVTVNSREILALRPFAPILDKSYRTTLKEALIHPAIMMYHFGIRDMAAQGYTFIYSIPNPAWARVLRLLPAFETTTFPLYSLPLPLARPFPIDPSYTVVPMHTLDDRVDRLWEECRRLDSCVVARDSASLRWKFGKEQYCVLGIERGGTLVGLTAGTRKGGRQWLLCDLLAADRGEALRATLRAACNFASEKALAADPDRPIRKTAILTTPVLEPFVRELDFARDDYDFLLAVQVLDPSLSRSEVHPSRWNVSAND